MLRRGGGYSRGSQAAIRGRMRVQLLCPKLAVCVCKVKSNGAIETDRVRDNVLAEIGLVGPTGKWHVAVGMPLARSFVAVSASAWSRFVSFPACPSALTGHLLAKLPACTCRIFSAGQSARQLLRLLIIHHPLLQSSQAPNLLVHNLLCGVNNIGHHVDVIITIPMAFLLADQLDTMSKSVLATIAIVY